VSLKSLDWLTKPKRLCLCDWIGEMNEGASQSRGI